MGFRMLLSQILAAVGASASAFAPFFPPAALISIGAGLASNIVNIVREQSLVVVDENGTPIELAVLAQRVSDHFAAAIALAQQGVAVADAELNKIPPR